MITLDVTGQIKMSAIDFDQNDVYLLLQSMKLDEEDGFAQLSSFQVTHEKDHSDQFIPNLILGTASGFLIYNLEDLEKSQYLNRIDIDLQLDALTISENQRFVLGFKGNEFFIHDLVEAL